MKVVSVLRPLLFGLLGVASASACATTGQQTMPAINHVFASGQQAALETAIRAHDRVALRRALEAGAAVNATGQFEITPLMIAVDVQNLEAVKALLGAGALPNARAADRNGPVSLAVKSYQATPHGRDILAAVINGGGDPDSRQPDGDPVLMQMILAHDPIGLKLMTSLGAHLDILDRGGDPFITNVAMSQDWDMVWAMLELGARYDYERGETRQPLSKALSLRYPAPDSPLYPYKLKVWQFLRDRGVTVQSLKN